MSKNRMEILDTQDILNSMADRHVLLFCLRDYLQKAYMLTHRDDDSKRIINRLCVLLDSYDLEGAVESLNKAIALLDEAQK
jgi:hypothetical protein